jgi:antibiotic biosynthesis monooxygenase (ABM) superfamily enzyme
MAQITTIVHFRVPAENTDRFLAFWQEQISGKMRQQPGLIDGILHRATDPDVPFQFINVARWESPEMLTAALKAADEALRADGVEMARVLADLGVTISQHNYVEAVRYESTTTSPTPST